MAHNYIFIKHFVPYAFVHRINNIEFHNTNVWNENQNKGLILD